MREHEHMIDNLTTNPKIAAVVMVIANSSNWFSNNFDLVLTRLTAVSSLVLIIVMIRYHLKNTRKIDQEKEIQCKVDKE